MDESIEDMINGEVTLDNKWSGATLNDLMGGGDSCTSTILGTSSSSSIGQVVQSSPPIEIL